MKRNLLFFSGLGLGAGLMKSFIETGHQSRGAAKRQSLWVSAH
jgi:hypothetical protein